MCCSLCYLWAMLSLPCMRACLSVFIRNISSASPPAPSRSTGTYVFIVLWGINKLCLKVHGIWLYFLLQGTGKEKSSESWSSPGSATLNKTCFLSAVNSNLQLKERQMQTPFYMKEYPQCLRVRWSHNVKQNLVSLHYRFGFSYCPVVLPSAQYSQGLWMPKLVLAKAERAFLA